MIELSKKYTCKMARGTVFLVGEKNDFVFGTVEDRNIDALIWGKQDGIAYSVSGGAYDLVEVRQSAIEEMIAWLEVEILRDRQSEASNMRYNSFARKTYGTALEEARRIRDSNATSDE